MKKYFFPIQVKSASKEVQITDEVCFKEITVAEKEHYFNIKHIETNENGLISDIRYKNPYVFHCLYDHALSLDNRDLNDYLLLSNYFLIVPDKEVAINVMFAINLLEHTKTGITIGHSSEGKFYSLNILLKNNSTKSEIFDLDKNLILLQRLMTDISEMSGKHLKRMILFREKFLSSLGNDLQNRFLELSVILEMLLVGKSFSEIGYKFRIRFANLVSKKIGDKEFNSNELLSIGKKIYETRSKIVHDGHSDMTPIHLPKLEYFARQILKLYVELPELFEDENLDAMCI
jgi:hypothetical protein